MVKQILYFLTSINLRRHRWRWFNKKYLKNSFRMKLKENGLRQSIHIHLNCILCLVTVHCHSLYKLLKWMLLTYLLTYLKYQAIKWMVLTPLNVRKFVKSVKTSHPPHISIISLILPYVIFAPKITFWPILSLTLDPPFRRNKL